MTSIDFNLKPRTFKIKSSKNLGNNSQNNKIESLNNDDRKNYFKNLSSKALEVKFKLQK